MDRKTYEILKSVESPFSDEMIKELIKGYCYYSPEKVCERLYMHITSMDDCDHPSEKLKNLKEFVMEKRS